MYSIFLSPAADLQAELKKTKAELTAEKDAAAAALSDKKGVYEKATGGEKERERER